VETYQNATLLATRNITGWPFYANGGYMGLWLVNAPAALLDNFRGGTRWLAHAFALMQFI